MEWVNGLILKEMFILYIAFVCFLVVLILKETVYITAYWLFCCLEKQAAVCSSAWHRHQHDEDEPSPDGAGSDVCQSGHQVA